MIGKGLRLILFSEINLSEECRRAVEHINYTEATDIQAAAIPLIMEGRDLIGRSNTGTGKTAAFGIPAVESIVGDVRRPQVLVLSPTRELAMQTCEEMRKFAKFKEGVRIAAVFGGQPMDGQIRQLRTANIVVGTPGRIMDHIRRRTLHLDEIRMVVLDEADEMLNMGFLEDIRTILSATPEERQTVLFSATMPPEILKITKEVQKDPEMVAVDKGRRTLDTITQYFYQVPMGRKMDTLNLLLQMQDAKKSIVFCNTKKMVDELSAYLSQHKFKCEGIHGDMKQAARTRVMDSFKDGRINILVATDVAARGIDVKNIEAVYNFDIPQDFEYYIHRIGRTGRASTTGLASTLVCNRKQLYFMRDIARYIRCNVQEMPIPSADDILARRQKRWFEKLVKHLDTQEFAQWEPFVEEFVEKGYSEKQVACAMIDLIAAKDKKQIPVVSGPSPAAQRPASPDRGDGRVRLHLNIGRNQQIAPNYIVAGIADGTGLPAKAIGKINIFNEYTEIDLSPEDAKYVLEKMKNSKIKGQRVQFTMLEGRTGGASGRYGRGGRRQSGDSFKSGGNRYQNKSSRYKDKRRTFEKPYND